MAKWLTQPWFDETRALVADQPLAPGLTAVLQFEVTGGPDGEVTYHWDFEDGRLASGAEGAADAPYVTLTMVWDDATAIQRGDLDPNVAFMQGRLKVAGSMAVMLALLPTLNTPEHQELRRRIAAATAF
jgi:predicted lipid carrier protein YhbT